MPQLTIATPGAPEQHVAIDRPCTLGGAGSELSAPGLGDALLQVTPFPAGLVLRCTRPIRLATREVAPETRLLLRSGEQVTVGSATLVATADALPEGTRELAGALLSGLDPTPPDGPTLLVVEGPAAGRRFPIRKELVVGRGTAADVALDDPLVSRRHLRLAAGAGGVLAFELPSKNGLLVNGARLRRSPARLVRGDELRIGGTVLVLEWAAALDGREPPRLRREEPDLGREEPAPIPDSPRPADRAWRRADLVAIASASAALLAAALLLARAAG